MGWRRERRAGENVPGRISWLMSSNKTRQGVLGSLGVCIKEKEGGIWTSRRMDFGFRVATRPRTNSHPSTDIYTHRHSKKKGDQEEEEQTKKPRKGA